MMSSYCLCIFYCHPLYRQHIIVFLMATLAIANLIIIFLLVTVEVLVRLSIGFRMNEEFLHTLT
jgi:hypothetical protein